jgi:hypothetical protein
MQILGIWQCNKWLSFLLHTFRYNISVWYNIIMQKFPVEFIKYAVMILFVVFPTLFHKYVNTESHNTCGRVAVL